MIKRVLHWMATPSRATLVQELAQLVKEQKELPERMERIERQIKRIDLAAFNRSLPARVRRGW